MSALTPELTQLMATRLVDFSPTPDWTLFMEKIGGTTKMLEILRNRGQDIEPIRDIQIIVRAALEKMGWPPIRSPIQAMAYWVSNEERFQQEANRWIAGFKTAEPDDGPSSQS